VLSIDALRELYRHMEWADALVWRAALRLDDAAMDDRLRTLLLHMHVVQRAFLSVWTGQSVTFPEETAFATFSSLRKWGQPYYAEVQRYFETLAAAQLEQSVVLPWIVEYEGDTGRHFETPTLAETAFQVTSHTTYHRGQVNTRLRELGVEPPLVDFIAWVWFGKPTADWGGESVQPPCTR
jgi:uncharacterized damage-inducible protein DinB